MRKGMEQLLWIVWMKTKIASLDIVSYSTTGYSIDRFKVLAASSSS